VVMILSVTHRAASVVGRRQRQDDVPETGRDRRGDRSPGRARLVVGDREDERAGDHVGVAADLGAQPVQQCAGSDRVVEVVPGG